MKRNYLVVSAIMLFLAFFGYYIFTNKNLKSAKSEIANFYLKRKTEIEQSKSTKETKVGEGTFEKEVIVEDLDIPWEIVFLPNGELLITERPGRLVKIGDDKQAIEVEGVNHIGEGGLLGAVLHPEFEDNKLIYLYITAKSEDGATINRVERYKFEENSLSERVTILDNIPGASYHDGGRIEFGPDGRLYITTGDAGNEDSSQDLSSLAGKILRLNDDGSVPNDNPYDSEVYSYGHRNSQGIAWDDQGRMWTTEHGRSGNASGYDELNLIEKGKNYGWPEIQGDEEREGMVKPVLHSGPSTTWAPAGLEFVNGKLYFSGLRGSKLYQVEFEEDGNLKLSTFFDGEYGRLRAVRKDSQDNLYISTSNKDGRGNVNDGDDKIIKVTFIN